MLIRLGGLRSAEEALEKAGLAWSVEPVELVTGAGRNVSTHKAICRGDTGQILGVVGEGYVPVQNTTAFAFADVIASRYGATYEFAGIVKNGRRVFLQAKLNESFEARRGDRIDSYITMVTSHDGSSSMRCFLTPIRLFCENQLTRAIRGATTNIALRHTASIEARIQSAFQVFSMSAHAFTLFREKSKYLARKVADKQMVQRFLDEVIGKADDSVRIANQRQKVTQLFQNGRGNFGQSAFELYNAAVEWVDHERGSDAEKRMDSAMFGSGALIKEQAFRSALAL
jgi:phage/plasmid-like protein (TIGR03299 family)